jgi:hypothetical protein
MTVQDDVHLDPNPHWGVSSDDDVEIIGQFDISSTATLKKCLKRVKRDIEELSKLLDNPENLGINDLHLLGQCHKKMEKVKVKIESVI